MDPAPDLAFVAPSLEELQPHFPTYAIEGFIAQGGMGAVYAARQVSLDRPVAIKILPRQFGADPLFRTSFEAEAKSMARLNHPNLIGVFDFGDADGMLFIIMELVEGKSLHHSAHSKAIEQREAGRLVAGICHGLAHAHSHGILHRDIKPSNILLGPGAEPRIGDFGLARPLGQEHNPDEVIWGTPGYAAPEVVGDPNSVDQRADIFAVGVILYELLTARLPEDPWQPPSRIAKCNPEFDAIIQRATNPDPQLRYPDAGQMGRQLDALVEKLQGPQLAAMHTGTSLGPAVARPLAPALAAPKSGSSAPMIIIATIVIALVGVLAVVLSQGSDDEENSSPKTEDQAKTPESEESSDPEVDPNPDSVVKTPDRDPDPDPDPGPDDPTPPDPPPTKLGPLELLAQARDDLKAGKLKELPEGVAEHRNSFFFVVSKPMDWLSASQFAEDHGAQLAVLEQAQDLDWAITQFQLESPVWLGLSDSGTEGKWYWTSGTPVLSPLWDSKQPNNTEATEDGEDFGALLPSTKRLDDLAGIRNLPFILEWPKNRSNPGSLRNQLQRTAAALKQGTSPIFPAGTRNIGGSRFLLMPQKLSWDEAQAMAVNAGGHLAVPSNDQEASWIAESLARQLGGGDGCWVGGLIKGVADPLWTFVTGERFEFVSWAPEEPDEDEAPQPVLQIQRSVDGNFGYHSTTRADENANYFLVEWSRPSRRNMPAKGELNRAANVEEWLLEQRKETIAREKVPFERWKRRHAKVVQDFIDDIESEADTARRSNQAIKGFVDDLTETIEKGGVVPDSLGNRLADRLLGDLHKRALSKQKRAWEDYEPDFEAAKQRYLDDLKAEVVRRKAQGSRKAQEFLGREIKAAEEDKYFRQILDEEFPEVPEAEDEDEDEDEDDD